MPLGGTSSSLGRRGSFIDIDWSGLTRWKRYTLKEEKVLLFRGEKRGVCEQDEKAS